MSRKDIREELIDFDLEVCGSSSKGSPNTFPQRASCIPNFTRVLSWTHEFEVSSESESKERSYSKSEGKTKGRISSSFGGFGIYGSGLKAGLWDV